MNNEKKMRVSDAEISLLNAVFADNDDLLLAVRNVFFGIANKEDKAFVKSAFSKKKELQTLMRKMFLPELNREIPIGQTVDLWLTIDIKEKDEDDTLSVLVSRNILIEYIEKSLILLEESDFECVNLVIDQRDIEKYTKAEILARNNFIQHIEGVLMQIKILAGMKNETAEQIKERISKNSTK